MRGFVTVFTTHVSMPDGMMSTMVCLFGFTISLKRVVSRPDDGRLCVQQVGESGKGATLPLGGSDSQGQLWKGTGFNWRNIS